MRKVLVVCGEDPRDYDEIRKRIIVVNWRRVRNKLPIHSLADASQTSTSKGSNRNRWGRVAWTVIAGFAASAAQGLFSVYFCGAPAGSSKALAMLSVISAGWSVGLRRERIALRFDQEAQP